MTGGRGDCVCRCQSCGVDGGRWKRRCGCDHGHGRCGGCRPDQMLAMTSLVLAGLDVAGTAGSAMGCWTGDVYRLKRESWAVMGLISDSTLPL